jgi:hypothetical protein
MHETTMTARASGQLVTGTDIFTHIAVLFVRQRVDTLSVAGLQVGRADALVVDAEEGLATLFLAGASMLLVARHADAFTLD